MHFFAPINYDVLIIGGGVVGSACARELSLASVRLTAPIPRDRIRDAMAAIRLLKVKAPVSAGAILVHDLLSFHMSCALFSASSSSHSQASCSPSAENSKSLICMSAGSAAP